jgi:hypothetical protein
MAREHGVFRTAKVLSLECGKLKRLTTGMIRSERAEKVDQVYFVLPA